MMDLRRALVSKLLKGILNAICEIDSREYIDALSRTSPAIIAVNHINFLEVPILVAQSYPRYVTGLVKEETWRNPLFAFLFDTYKAIPIDRHGAYKDVFHRVRSAIDQGFFVAIAPEGTRSGNGVLGRGKAGIIQLALLTGAPILPVVYYGGERVWHNIRRFRRTPFRFRVGRPFRIRFEGRPGKSEREEILREVMGQMARLLPEEMRGPYAEEAGREVRYLEFIPSP
jgi:1-acyl-sn-glycerol-3-phosphate acyltransferase